jgi:hypothetical protein
LPVLYNIQFKGKLKLKNEKHFKWYAGAGPVFSYWLGGKGTIKDKELTENEIPQLDYKIKFGARTDQDEGRVDVIYLKDVKRFQLGFNIGAGLILEPPNSISRIMLDMRFEIGHTWLGKPKSADYVIPVTYDDNLKARNMGFRLSAMYLFEFNLDKKVRKKGKSTFKKNRI